MSRLDAARSPRRRARGWSRRRRRAGGPARARRSTRATSGPGDLFVGLPGERVDGGALRRARRSAAGAWGVLVAPEHADGALRPAAASCSPPTTRCARSQRSRRAWRRELGASVIGVTGSTGKTSTKDILAAMLAPHRRTVATPQNLNTEIGLPLTILGAPAGTEVLVLEMAMRGAGPDRRAGARSPSPTSA